MLAGLDTADLLTVNGEGGERGSLVLLVAGDPYGGADEREGAGSILSTTVSVLDARSDGVVLAGPVSSSADDGLVGTVRADPTDRGRGLDRRRRRAGGGGGGGGPGAAVRGRGPVGSLRDGRGRRRRSPGRLERRLSTTSGVGCRNLPVCC